MLYSSVYNLFALIGRKAPSSLSPARVDFLNYVNHIRNAEATTYTKINNLYIMIIV